jgi:hypothetical protein
MATQCEDELVSNQDQESQELLDLKQTIEDLASTSVCKENTECKYIAFGSKPCGGPWSYIVYSTSIDTENLKNLVENYNQQESEYNAKWGVISDCSVNTPPISITCENNTCKAVY